MKSADIEARRISLQAKIDSDKTIDSRRRMGQFATPTELATAIVRETRRYLGKGKKRMLEPAMGTGAFVSAVRRECGDEFAITGIELDADFHRAAKELWSADGVEVVNGDFTKLRPSPDYDLVIANPPYVRHHSMSVGEKRRLQALALSLAHINISGLAGLYCYFLLLSHAWMKPGAIGVWLIPSEWMSVNYGSAIRDFLAYRVELLRVHRFDSSDVRFSDALVSSCVVWFRCGGASPSSVEFSFGSDIERPDKTETVAIADLRVKGKWQVDSRSDGDSPSNPHLRDFFDIRRGIATGDNGFFVMPEETVRSRKFPKKFLRPILPSPRHLKVNHVYADETGVPINADRRFLLDCTGYELEELPDMVREYLESGLETTAKRNLCASRTVWYGQEQRSPARLLCSYMGRGAAGKAPVRFILNESAAIASNSFLMLYPRGDLTRIVAGNPNAWQVIWRLLANIPGSVICREGRSYGGGLQKVEPKELGNVTCSELGEYVSAFRGCR